MEIDLFPDFEEAWFETPNARLYARIGGPRGAPAVLLLHGFPQSHLCWHPVAPALAETYRVICLDMKGYGDSSAPIGDSEHEAYSKRTIALEAEAVMTQAGYSSFSVFGHDRGGQVAYRMALDMPDRITHVAVLDNMPVFAVWDLINANPGIIQHWKTLARPGREAEKDVTAEYIEGLVRAHTADGTLDCFHPAALAQYRRSWSDPERVHAFCEDYRAGATVDLEADKVDLAAGHTITCPALILWGKAIFGRLAEPPLKSWTRSFAPEAVGVEVEYGHFVMEENPRATLKALRELLTRTQIHTSAGFAGHNSPRFPVERGATAL